MSRTVQLTEELISRRSITPEDAGCMDLIAARLAPLGFICERMDHGPENFRVRNLWAVRRSNKADAANPRIRRAHGRRASRAFV
jgi:succinyl-diaminopimelate desuccinylase